MATSIAQRLTHATQMMGIILAFVICQPASGYTASSVYIEDMTWMEVRDAIAVGKTTVIVPIGSAEQNGPHMTINKHNIIVHVTAGDIAKRLGNALVAPVIPFSPAGRITPPEGHMQFAGTVSLAPETLGMVLEDVARSLKQHGFRTIAFVGDHGGSQDPQRRTAERLNSEWSGSGAKALHVSDYYDSHNGQEPWAQSIGLKVRNPAAHAGFFDTSELMAASPASVDNSKLGVRAEKDYSTTGAMGDSSKATANYGRRLLSLKVEAAVAQIQSAVAR